MVGRIGCHLVVRVQTCFTPLQYDFVRMQTRFAPCNTISYACKHVLRLVIRFRTHANTFCALQHDFVCVQTRFTSLQQTIRGSIWPLHRCSKRFGGRNDRYIVAANDSGVEMTVTSLQQTIRGSIWPLHRCSKRFGGRNDRYIVAANDSGVEMAVTSLQQTIRGSKWPLHCCSKRFGGQNGLLHHCNTA